jgi:integrase
LNGGIACTSSIKHARAVTPTRMLRPPLGAKSFEAAAHIIFQVQPLSPPSSSLSISPCADEANIRSADEGCDYSFTTNAAAPISSFSALKLKLDIACGATTWTQGWRLHHLQRTARSLMSRAGVNPDIAKRCLGHVIGGVRGVYDRHKFVEEMRHAFEALATQIERIVLPVENVVAMTR